MPTAITISGLVKSFGAGPPAVDGMSLDINPGELFFLLGPSGCGKTTLLRMIAGFIDPTAGTIAFDGRDVTRLPPGKRNTGMVFQSYALWPHMTVAQNVAFGLEMRRIPASERARRVQEALAAVRMEAYASRKPNQLSGGQQQRIALARALVVRPDVLLLDEPLSNLDARLRMELRSEIRRVCKDAGITTIYVTHDQKEALSMADRIAILNRGRVVQVGAPADLYRRPRTRFVAEFLGDTNLIPVTVTSSGPPTRLQSPIGPLISSHPAPAPTALASIRPEAIKLTPPPTAADTNFISGILVDTIYLGDLVQCLMNINDYNIHITVLGGDTAIPPSGSPATLSIQPEDVVLVPA